MRNQETKEYIRKMIPSENLMPLDSVAEMLVSRPTGRSGKNFSVYEYPLDYEKLKEGRETTVQLHKYDIIMRGCMPKKLYMVDEEPHVPIFAAPTDAVIRPLANIQPEYLYLFLKSKTGQEVMAYFAEATSCQPRLRKSDFHNIYIAEPTLSELEYRTTFEIENHYNLSYEKYNELIGRFQNANQDGISAVFNEECFKEILKNKETAFVQLIRTDIAELNACYNAKAYKATLIIAGSILEAVLLDWLGEIDGVDYFKEGQENKHGDNLYDFIKAIKYIKNPKWEKGADMSHKIRLKRNLVHAKLGFKSNEVNDETCKMVLEYLEYVIQTRTSLAINE